jgi:hypothetical protein
MCHDGATLRIFSENLKETDGRILLKWSNEGRRRVTKRISEEPDLCHSSLILTQIPDKQRPLECPQVTKPAHVNAVN